MMATVAVLPHEAELGPQRRCSRCGEWWPLGNEFWRRKVSRGRPYHACRACIADDLRASRERNRESYLARNRESQRRYRARLAVAR